MRRQLRSISFALACIPLAAGFPSAAQARDCRPVALEALQTAAPEGFAIFQKVRDKKFFLHWISCGEKGLGLSTAVHESVHYLASENDAFPLINGGQLKLPHEVSRFYPPGQIAGKFKPSEFV